jgi:hypothetical protein
MTEFNAFLKNEGIDPTQVKLVRQLSLLALAIHF